MEGDRTGQAVDCRTGDCSSGGKVVDLGNQIFENKAGNYSPIILSTLFAWGVPDSLDSPLNDGINFSTLQESTISMNSRTQ